MAAYLHHSIALVFALLANADCSKSSHMAAGTAGNVQSTSAIADDDSIDLRVTLLPRDPERLAASIAKGEVLTPKQYAYRHGPTDSMLAEVHGYLAAHGISAKHLGGHVIHATPNNAQLQAALSTEVVQFKNRVGQKMLTKTKSAYWPEYLPPVVITGLSTRPPKINHAKFVGRKHDYVEQLKARDMPYGLSAKTVRSVYNMPSTATGKHRNVAMIELDGYDPTDLDVYASTMGIRRVPTRNILLDGTDGTIQDQGARGEVTLDIQLAMAMAPDLDAIVVYEAPNGDHALNDIYNRIANPQAGELLIRSISCSWGEPESYMTQDQVAAENVLLQQLAAQGQTIFVAAGDSGARDDGSKLGTDDPASQPYAIAVGGTNVQVSNSTWISERTWSGGGGGISQFWPSPSWQKGIEGKQTYASLTMRDVPDVALNADPNSGYAVYVGGWQVVGGTSCAAPLWAAFMQVANQQRADAGKKLLPYFAPVLYAVGQSQQYKTAMHDVADRSTNGYYPAVVGIDAATGWGTINGAPLLSALVAQP